MEIFYTARFKREYRKVPRPIQIKAKKKEAVFLKNPFATSLKTHKLHGELRDLWAFSVDYSYRIVFEFERNGSEATFYFIGDHDIYR